LRGVDDFGHQRFADFSGVGFEQFNRKLALFINRDAEAVAELGVIFKERICPCRAVAVFVLRPRRGWQVAAEN
jgi:hypothetical protein